MKGWERQYFSDQLTVSDMRMGGGGRCGGLHANLTHLIVCYASPSGKLCLDEGRHLVSD